MADRKRKTVCIVGAGPSGLAAAKNLIWDKRARCSSSPSSVGGFRVTIVEAQPRIGGLWPTSPDDTVGLVHPLMLANQSRHTVQLSGVAWDDDAPTFPRAWQIGAYLERYYQRYLRGPQEAGDLTLQLGRRVVRAEPIDGGKGGWHVWTQESGADVSDAGVFDYLAVASGFFGSPSVPEAFVNAIKQDGAAEAPTSVPTVHTSAYRDLDTLFGGKVPSSGKIVVAGGQFSGVEIAATIAGHLSNKEHAPGGKTSSTLSVHHIVQQPFWVFPLHTSPIVAASSPPFLPFDLTSYNVLKRPQPLTDTQGHIPVETARTVHGIFSMLLGTDQSDIHPALALPQDSPARDAPPYIAVSDTYLEHVRSGTITLSRGKLEDVQGTQATISSTSSSGSWSGSSSVDDVAAVVLATGFTPASSLSFFPDSVKETLHYEASDLRQPLALAFHDTHHPDVPGLAFVGFYRSPYWGVMEMQARVATALFTENAASQIWASSSTPQWPYLSPALAADHSIERTLALRADPDRASQFPMGDYLYLMNSFGEALGIPRRSGAVKEGAVAMDIVTPMHYFDGDGDHGDENTAGEELTVDAKDNAHAIGFTKKTTVAGLKENRFVARAVFRSLQGTWKLDRTLTSRLPSHPSGRFVGTAEFRLREGTKDGFSGSEMADDEYLYVEDGTFTALNGPSFRATRRYVWRYNERLDKLSVWFARTDDASKADYLFHALEFSPTEKGWKATAGHLCIDDFYDVHYQFSLKGVNLTKWTLEYAVRGPKKDYTISGAYQR
ncbi:hypothetical protein SBRCBS47491_006627 [Sporothrix bragantina]|uniref:DUF6314 domain-containing protein n=1 Tax=Sporothrix bragantina TaxID=671064 RepID=A0ABP0C6G5_9PEZI